MNKQLAAIGLIYVGAALAWFILGGTIGFRTSESDTTSRNQLGAQWGSAQVQVAPDFSARIPHDVVRYFNTEKVNVREYSSVDLPIRSSRIAVGIDLTQRRKGLLWYNLYDVRFDAAYTVRNTSTSSDVSVAFKFPDSGGNFSDLRYVVNGRVIDALSATSGSRIAFKLDPGATARVEVKYTSRGNGSWQYSFGKGTVAVNDLQLSTRTNFGAIDFPPASLLPTTEERAGNGWLLSWNYGTLVTSNGIGMAIPEPLQPGPLAQRITVWAPVSLLFYFFVLTIIVTLRKIELHPYNYFFLACAFFSFHLLFAYLVDRIPVEWAFVTCAVVSMFLTVTYLRLVVGLRFAAVESGAAQLIYLVLFSLALFNEGWSGLTITIGAIVTLFVVMQLTGRIRWGVSRAPALGTNPSL